MPLAKQNLSLSFAEGVDTKTDNKQVLPGRLLTLENGIFIAPKRITKRNGYLSLGTMVDTGSSPLTGAVALATFKDELNLFDGTLLFSYAQSLTKYTDKGAYTSLEATTAPIVRNAAEQTTPDMARHSVGLSVYTWEDSRGAARYSVVDEVTGEYLVQDMVIGPTVSKPKPFALGMSIIIIYQDTVTIQLNYVALTVVSPTILGAPVLITTNLNSTNPNWDVSAISTRVFVGYNTNDVGNGIGLFYIDSFLVQSVLTTVAGENADEAIGLFDDDSQNVWVAYANGSNIKVFVYSYNLNILVLPPTTGEAQTGVRNICGEAILNSPTSHVIYELSAPEPFNAFIRQQLFTIAGGAGAASLLYRSVGLASKVEAHGEHIYFLVVHESPLQPTYFLVDESGNVVAKAASGIAGGLTTKTSILPELMVSSADAFTVAILQKDIVVPASTEPLNLYTNMGIVSLNLNFAAPTTYLTAQLGEALHITGGFLSMYDAFSVVEHGFHLFPENVSIVTSPVGGFIGAGTYQYFVVYEWMDNQGKIHQSAPSIAVSITTIGATSSNNITVSTLRLTAKKGLRTPVSIVFYRTQANLTQPFRVSSITASPANDVTIDTITFTDTLNDADIIGNQVLYTFGGVVDNIAAPAVSSITTYNNRLVAIPSEDKASFWFSKEVVAGAPVEFSDLFVQKVDPRGGGLTGAVQMDDKLILFREPSVSFIVGTGPAPTGANNDFSNPTVITTDVGCTNQRSIVLMPLGVMFQSAKGIYILDRSLKVDYIGAPVEAFNGLTITSADLMPTVNQVRFASAEGTCLVYDYFFNQWSVFTGITAVDATVFENQHVWVQASGRALQETPGVFTDDGQYIKLRLVTSWFSLAGLQAFQRAYRLLILGEFKSAHRLLVKVAYDFNPFFTQTTYIDVGALFPLNIYGDDNFFGESSPWGGDGGFPLYQFEVHLRRQKCESIQFSLEDIQVPPYGEGLNLSALGLQIGVKQGLNKMPASRRFG